MRGWISGGLVVASWGSVGVLCWSLTGSTGVAEGQATLVVPLADGFDWPVGPPDGRGYYDAQPFGVNLHLGEDWNGVGGGSSDYGDAIHSAAAGRVTFVGDGGPGWGRVVRILHRYTAPGAGAEREVETLYAHLSASRVDVGQVVARGQIIGNLGDADGIYVAHLHFEVRDAGGLPLGGGYGRDTQGYLSPSVFIRGHRPRP